MSFEIIYSKDSIKQLKKLTNIMRKRILLSLERIRIRPYPHVKKLVSSPYFRLRVGDYRIILDIVDNKLQILVIELGHRKNIYKE
jgi:mRNA interferase RelE/StbE